MLAGAHVHAHPATICTPNPKCPTPNAYCPLLCQCTHTHTPLQFMERLQNKHGFGFMAVSLGYFGELSS